MEYQKIIVVIPALLGYAASYKCPMTNQSGSNVNFRPPAVAFGIVWPLLYLCLGYAWYRSGKTINIPYILISLMLAAWIILYSCYNKKKEALWLLYATLAVLLPTIVSANDTITIYLLSPLFVWLLFAGSLSSFDISK